jgi:hypothetical protein
MISIKEYKMGNLLDYEFLTNTEEKWILDLMRRSGKSHEDLRKESSMRRALESREARDFSPEWHYDRLQEIDLRRGNIMGLVYLGYIAFLSLGLVADYYGLISSGLMLWLESRDQFIQLGCLAALFLLYLWLGAKVVSSPIGILFDVLPKNLRGVWWW